MIEDEDHLWYPTPALSRVFVCRHAASETEKNTQSAYVCWSTICLLFFFCSQLTGLAAPPYLRPPPLPSARCSETNKSKAARGWGICACQSGERKRRGRSSREGRRGGREGESEGFQRASGEAELTRSQRAMGGRLG